MPLIDRDGADALIPYEQSMEIIQQLPEESAALSLFRHVPMSRKQTRLPVLSALPNAYWVTGDTGQKKTDKQAWKNKFLTAEELAVIIPIPEAVLDDSEFDIWGEVKPRAVEAFGAGIDNALFFGVNKPDSFPSCVVDLATDAGNAFVRGSIGSQDLSVDIDGEGGVMNLIEDDGFDPSGFAAHRTFRGSLRGLRATTGELIYQRDLTSKAPDALEGMSIFFSGNGAWDKTLASLICGDFSQGIIGLRQDITTKLLDQAVIQDENGDILYNLAQQDMVAVRFTMRLAYQVPNPVNRENPDDGTRCPFSVLLPVGGGSGS